MNDDELLKRINDLDMNNVKSEWQAGSRFERKRIIELIKNELGEYITHPLTYYGMKKAIELIEYEKKEPEK